MKQQLLFERLCQRKKFPRWVVYGSEMPRRILPTRWKKRRYGRRWNNADFSTLEDKPLSTGESKICHNYRIPVDENIEIKVATLIRMMSMKHRTSNWKIALRRSAQTLKSWNSILISSIFDVSNISFDIRTWVEHIELIETKDPRSFDILEYPIWDPIWQNPPSHRRKHPFHLKL